MSGPTLFPLTTLSSYISVLQRAIPTSRSKTSHIFTSIRHESTTRRMTKALRLHPHASFIGTASTIPSRSSHPPPSLSDNSAGSLVTAIPNIIHNPPASAPTPYNTPKLFLPPEDPRYSTPSPTSIRTKAQITTPSPEGRIPAVPTSLQKKLPPALTRPYEKTYHLTEEDIKQIQKLRASNPDKWTRRRLGEKFGCSEFFVGMVAPTTEERKEKMKKRQEHVKNRWGKVRTFAREERQRRRELWSKDL